MKPRSLLLLLPALLIGLASGCGWSGSAPTPRVYVGKTALGAVEVTFQVVATSEGKAGEAIAAATAAISEVNNLLNAYLEQSEISRLNRSGSAECHVSTQTASVLRRAVEISELTGGAFDVTAGPLIRLWKKPIKAALEACEAGRPVQVELPNTAEIEAARKLTGYRNLVLGPNSARLTVDGMSVDLGGIAKGYAVDRAVEALKAHGITSALVAVAGDGYVLGARPDGTPWRVGIQDPDRARGERLPDVLQLSNSAYSTSGDYEQYVDIDGVRYAHIVDPRTGQPARKAASVTVLAPDCTTADALATGISVLGPEEGEALVETLPGIECMVITRQGERLDVTKTSGFGRYVAP